MQWRGNMPKSIVIYLEEKCGGGSKAKPTKSKPVKTATPLAPAK